LVFWENCVWLQYLLSLKALLSEEENLLIINRLHQVLRPFVLRRLKHKVLFFVSYIYACFKIYNTCKKEVYAMLNYSISLFQNERVVTFQNCIHWSHQ
jgi:hypothetical protein